MKNAGPLIIALAMFVVAAGDALASDQKRQAEQARLDAACEAARQKQIAIDKAKYIDECVEKEQRPDRAACERFYAGYGERAGDRPALYYDLPECEKAHAFRSSYRQ